MLLNPPGCCGAQAYLHTTAQFVFDANAAGQVPEYVWQIASR